MKILSDEEYDALDLRVGDCIDEGGPNIELEEAIKGMYYLRERGASRFWGTMAPDMVTLCLELLQAAGVDA